MPLNFPDNPVDNQVYSPTPQKAWVYNASQGTWLASNVSSQGTKVTVQDAAPLNSDQCDLWFNSETGSLNVNYDDTTSEQWVNISSSGIIESEDVINDNTMLTASESTLATSSSIKAYVDDIVRATVSLDDIKMFNFRSNGDVSKGYMESGDIDTFYRGSLPVSFDSDVKFVELKYTSAIANVPSDAEDGVNGTVYIDWENKKIKQSSVKKDGGNPHQSHWYESTGAESNGVIMFNSSEGTTGTPEGTSHLEGIVIDWDSRQITGLPHYVRDSGGGVSYKYDWQYIFRDLTNSGSFGSAGGGGGGSSLLKYGEMSIGRVGGQTNASIPTVGDFTAVADDTQDGDTNDDTFVCTFNTPLDNNNYNVIFETVSNGNVDVDNTLRYPVLVDKTSTGFVFNVEFAGVGAMQADGDIQINVRVESNEVGAGISADKEYVGITGTSGATAITQTAQFGQSVNGTYTYQVNDLQGPGVNTSKIRGLYIRCKGTTVNGTSILTATLPDDITLLRPFFQTSELNNVTGSDVIELIKFLPINKNQSSFKLKIDTVVGGDIEYEIIGAEQITATVGSSSSSSSSVAPSIIIKYADNSSLGGGSASTWEIDPVVDIAVDGVAGVSVSSDNKVVSLPNGTYRYAFIYTSTNTTSTYRTQLSIRAGARQLLTSNSWSYSGNASEQGTINVTSGGIVFEGMRYNAMANVYGAYLMLIPTADFTNQVSIEAARPELLGKIQ